MEQHKDFNYYMKQYEDRCGYDHPEHDIDYPNWFKPRHTMTQTSNNVWEAPDVAYPEPPDPPSIGWSTPYPTSVQRSYSKIRSFGYKYKCNTVDLVPNPNFSSEMKTYNRLQQEYIKFQASDIVYPPIKPKPMVAWDINHLPPKNAYWDDWPLQDATTPPAPPVSPIIESQLIYFYDLDGTKTLMGELDGNTYTPLNNKFIERI